MPEHSHEEHNPPEHPDWNPALPEVVSDPTPWPAMLALGSTLLLWGFVTSYIIFSIGVILFAISLAYWIGDIRHERRTK